MMASDRQGEARPLLGWQGTKKSSPVVKEEAQLPQPSRPGVCGSLSVVTVEPALFLTAMSYGIEMVFKTNMLVDKTCSILLNYSSDVCSDLDSGKYETQQDTTQSLTSKYNLYCQMIELLPGALVMMVLGTWSDTRDRRLPLLLPLAGSMLKSFGLWCTAFWWSLQPLYVPLSFIPFGLSGGMMAIFMAAYAYVSDESGLQGRTTRLAIVGLAMLLALPLGNAIGAVFFSYGGYVAVFGLDFIVSFLALMYGAIRLKKKDPRAAAGATQEKGTVAPWSQLLRSVKTVLRQRPGGGRACILGHGCCIVLFMTTMGVIGFTVLYTRLKFKWNYKQYTVWNIWNSAATVLASCVLLPLLSYRFHVDDTILAFSGAVSHIFFGLFTGAATESWMLYVGAVISAGGGLSVAGSRGALSKLVEPDELGAVFSVVGIFESLAPVISAPIYTLVYNATLTVWPGTVFLITAGITVVMCFIYTWLGSSYPVLPEVGSKETRGSP